MDKKYKCFDKKQKAKNYNWLNRLYRFVMCTFFTVSFDENLLWYNMYVYNTCIINLCMKKKNIILDFNKLLIHIKGKLYLI